MGVHAFEKEDGSLTKDKAAQPVFLFGWGGRDYTYYFNTDKLRVTYCVVGYDYDSVVNEEVKFIDLPRWDREELLASVCPD